MQTIIISIDREQKKIKACFYLQSIQETVYPVVGRHPKPSVSHPTKQENILNEHKTKQIFDEAKVTNIQAYEHLAYEHKTV